MNIKSRFAHGVSDTLCVIAASVFLCKEGKSKQEIKEYVEKTGDRTTVIIDSTASPYKFSGSVLKAVANGEELPDDEFEMVDLLSRKTNTEVPKPLAALKDKEVRFTSVVDADEMPDFVLNSLGVK